MKTTVTVEDGKVTIQVDDNAPVVIGEPEGVPMPGGTVLLDKPIDGRTKLYDPENCGYCRKRGEPCVRHGGDDSQNYPGKAGKRKQGRPASESAKAWNGAGGVSDTPRLAAEAPVAIPEYRSKCHDAKVKVVGDSFGEGTNHYECLACGQACDFYEHLPPFHDTWNCGACREAGRLCRLHADMEADGKRAPGSRDQLTTNRKGVRGG